MADLRSRRLRVGRLWTGAAVSTAVLLGAGSVAVAGNGMETPWGWTADNVYSIPGPEGKTCFAGMQVKADGVAEDAEVMHVARDIVAQIDLDNLDTTGPEQERKSQIGKPFDDGAPGTISYTTAEMKQSAVHEAVAKILFAELEQRGFATPDHGAPVSLFSQAVGCN